MYQTCGQSWLMGVIQEANILVSFNNEGYFLL